VGSALINKYRYTAFGLNIESELELPELNASMEPADITVVYGKTPQQLEAPAVKTPWLEIKAGEFLLTVDSIARFYAEKGRRIIIEPFDNTDEDDIRVFLLDSVFAALLQQRGFPALHGSAAVIKEKAVAMLGKSTVGKTAVALALYDRSCRLLTDEICAVGLRNGRAVIHPGAPWLHVWKDTLEASGKNINTLRPIRRELNKYSLPAYDRFSGEVAEISHIFVLCTHNRDEIITETVTGGVKMEILVNNTFFTETVSDKTRHFKIYTAAAAARVIRVSFNNNQGMAEKIADVILREANK
jgi:hypothetical protein